MIVLSSQRWQLRSMMASPITASQRSFSDFGELICSRRPRAGEVEVEAIPRWIMSRTISSELGSLCACRVGESRRPKRAPDGTVRAGLEGDVPGLSSYCGGRRVALAEAAKG